LSATDTPLITLRLAAGLVLVSVLSLIAFAALSAYAPELRSDISGGGNALSKSAVGFAGLRFLAEQAGISTYLGREPPPADRYSLIVLTPEPATAPSEVARIAYPGPRLIVLPKWITASQPGHSGWVMKVDIADTKSIASSLASITIGATVAQRRGVSRTHILSLDWRFGSLVPQKPVSLDSIQTISGPFLEPDIVDDHGNAVLVQIHGTQIYILAEPDLLNNRGMHDLSTARMAFGLIQMLRVGPRPIAFDITLNGFRQSPSLLRAMFSPPFLGATLCAMLAAAFIGFHAFSRFGAAERPDRVFAFGKRALADNTAAVIRLMHREPPMAPRYAQAMLNLVAAHVGIPREQLDDPAWIRIAEQRSAVQYRFSDLKIDAANVRDNGGLIKVAAKLYKWRRGILYEHR
jgi:hypothetical protein